VLASGDALMFDIGYPLSTFKIKRTGKPPIVFTFVESALSVL